MPSLASTHRLSRSNTLAMLLCPDVFGQGLHQSDAEPPKELECPTTHEIMDDPVICSDGFTYERRAIQQSMTCGNLCSPFTNKALDNTTLIPNREAKARIAEWKQHNRGAKGLQKALHDMISQITTAETPEVVCKICAKLAKLLRKYDVCIPVLGRKLKLASLEWRSVKKAAKELEQLIEICDEKASSLRDKYIVVSEIASRAEMKERATNKKIRVVKDDIKNRSTLVKELNGAIGNSRNSLKQLQKERDSYKRLKTGCCE